MRFLIFILVFFITPFSLAHAQVKTDLAGSEVTIDLEPSYPEPLETFTASLNDYSFTSEVTSITWKVDGVVVGNSKNQREITATTKEAGVKTQVEASITVAGGGTQVVKKVITPLYLDVVVEAQTKTPVFYQGRALPSIGSTVNLTALLSGNNALPSAQMYTWSLNNQVIEGGSVRGKNTVSIKTPIGQTFLVTLEISSLDGTLLTRRTIQLPAVTPTISFYETSTLYGIKNKAISSLNLTGNSATIKAVPIQ